MPDGSFILNRRSYLMTLIRAINDGGPSELKNEIAAFWLGELGGLGEAW